MLAGLEYSIRIYFHRSTVIEGISELAERLGTGSGD